MALSGVEFLIAMDRAKNPSMCIPAKKGTEKYKRIMEFSEMFMREERQEQLNKDFIYNVELGNVKQAEKLFWKGADVNTREEPLGWNATMLAADNDKMQAMLNRITLVRNLRFLGKDVIVPFYRAFRKCITA